MRPAVYIPNFNGPRRIGRALRSLREQSRPIDVVVVDNGSERRLGGAAARASSPR